MRESVGTSEDGGGIMRQVWRDLLFLHWSVDPAFVQPKLPPGLEVETFEGRAWLGVVPFWMSGVRPRGLPALPGLSRFQELNLRTYAKDAEGRSGVYFFSLDCHQPIAVWAARTFFHLNYVHARMRMSHEDGRVDFQWWRRGGARGKRVFGSRFIYAGHGNTRPAEPGSLDFFLLERYTLFAPYKGRIRYGRVAHGPYAIEDAELTAWDDKLLAANGFERLKRPPDHVRYVSEVRVSVPGLPK